MVRYELLMLAELGFGLDLELCAVSGSNDDLVAVSPRSGRAVSAARSRALFRQIAALAALRSGWRDGSMADILDGLALTGHFLMRDLLTDRSAPVGDARDPAG